tara:strand:- start:1610 stop:1792 length:183 start_codon:yes stop_codon:yes gene_type:complete
MNTKNEHQELAEKAAGCLGVEIDNDFDIIIRPSGMLSWNIFSWPVTGLMIEHLQGAHQSL